MAGWIAAKLLDTIAEKLLEKMIALIPKTGKLTRSGSASSPGATDLVQELERLESRLLKIKSVLRDAEEREIQDESVNLWLREIKLVAYDAEDLLDEYEYELLRSQIEGRVVPESTQTSSSSSSSRKRKLEETEDQVWDTNSSSCSLVSPVIAEDLVDRINKINQRIDEIIEDGSLIKKDGLSRKDDWMIPLPTGSHVDESNIYGREEDRDRVVDLLLSGDEKFTVLPIVGMGGLGKTTLAQLVYRDERIDRFFNLKAWVCASDDFDIVRLCRAMIESFSKQRCDLTELSALQDILKEEVEGKRVFLVLDDIWNEDQSAWDLLKAPLVGAKIMKIIITTRNLWVARITQTMSPYYLNCLSEEESWLLFQRHAFADQDPNEQPILKQIGMRIVRKCAGLPLAVKVVGGLLRHKKANEESWKDILQGDFWELDATQHQILPALRLSYRFLPAYLKSCFVYCSLFPKDYEFEKDRLIQLWMAQGYIIQPQGIKSAEDLGREYVEELERRSLLQYAGYGLFRMHDLVHDLASYISGKECFQIVVESDKETYHIPYEVRHLYIISQIDVVPRRLFSCLPGALRTLVFDGSYSYAILDEQFPLQDLTSLRVLELRFHQVKGLPDSFANLKHLRYLRVKCGSTGMGMEKLPESIGELHNLQVLDFWWVKELPSGIENLVNLCFLRGVCRDTCMPRGVGKLANLKTLEYFNVRRGAWHCGIKDLKGLVNLRGCLHITGLSNVARVEDARGADLESKWRIETLVLDWDGADCEQHGDKVNRADVFLEEQCRDAELEAAVMDSLQPHANLRKLEIWNYHGARFPRWLGDPSFSRLVHVYMYGNQNCEHLPALGQLPSLRHLSISQMNSLRYVGREFCCALPVENVLFPSLEWLTFEDMPEWEEWSGLADGDLPRLSELLISNCSKLRSVTLPQTPTAALRVLEIKDSPRLSSLVVGLHRLTSLHWLTLTGCPELRIPPYERLPSIPNNVTIKDCPGLNEWCQAQGINHQQSIMFSELDKRS